MRLHGLPCARALPRLRTAELAVRFDPRAPDATPAPHAAHTWSSRITRALRNAALQQPRASTAPILSILTLVLLVGGYVVVDRTCKADPACRGSNDSRAMASDAAPYASNDPVLPVLPAPVYPFHSTDGTQAAVARPGSLARKPPVHRRDGRQSRERRRPYAHPTGRTPPPRFASRAGTAITVPRIVHTPSTA